MEENPNIQQPASPEREFKVAASAAPEDALYKARLMDPPARLGQVGKLDRYELLQELGRGGMGVVYLARDSETGEKVALKTLRRELVGIPEAVDQFLNEARTVADLDHPYIVPILDVSRRPDQPYFVMPYYPHGTLADRLKRSGALPIEEVCRFGFQIASAIKRLQWSERAHGDLKPSNVLLDGKAFNARVTDFGLARDFATAAGLDDVRARIRKGTAPYMSPQMVEGEGEGFGADIYMFGATLYELLTGRPPYDGDSNETIYQKIRAGPPIPVLQLRPDAPPALVRIIEKAMARDEEARYRKMKTVLRDLNAIYAETPSPRYHLLRRLHAGSRGRGVLAALVLAALVPLVALGGWLLKRSPRTAVHSGLHPIRQIQVPGLRNWSEALPGDWDGDGLRDLYLAQDNVLKVVSTDGEVLTDHRLAVPPQAQAALRLVGDIDRDKRDEAFLSWRADGRMYIDVFTQSSFGVRRFETDGATFQDNLGVRHTTSLLPVRLHELDGDGNPELLAILHAGVQGKPRGVGCLELTDGKIAWLYQTAPNPEAIAVGDVTGDGTPEIVVGSYAHANGIALQDGTDDGHAYVYLLDRQGKLLWLKELGDRFVLARPELADLDRDGVADLLVAIIASDEFRQPQGELGRLLRMNARGEVVGSYDFGVRLYDSRVAFASSGGPAEIFATDRLGRVHVLGGDLSLRRQVSLRPQTSFEVVTEIHAVEDLDGDGQIELIASTYEREARVSRVSGDRTVIFTHHHTLYVLSADLTVRAQHELYQTRKAFPGMRVVTSDLDRDGRKEVIVLTDEAIVFGLGS